ncbi:MAG: hypothetical protein II738_06825 [Clostridia bacterium]|nr:hypothetical protein [Clostridia bacterium]
MNNNGFVTDRVTRGADGKYRWVYALNLYKNPSVFWLVWKILFGIILGIFAVVTVADLLRGDVATAAANLPFMLYFTLGMTALVGLGYLLYAAMTGGRYVVLFEMDETGVTHRQIPAQAKKAKALGAATALAGMAAGSPTAVGVGLNAQRTEMASDFSKVRAVKAYPRRHLIKVNGRFSRNQVYVPAEDFIFVRDYIVSRCPNARKQ